MCPFLYSHTYQLKLDTTLLDTDVTIFAYNTCTPRLILACSCQSDGSTGRRPMQAGWYKTMGWFDNGDLC